MTETSRYGYYDRDEHGAFNGVNFSTRPAVIIQVPEYADPDDDNMVCVLYEHGIGWIERRFARQIA